MKKNLLIKMLFIIAAIYDGVLGGGFLFAGEKLFQMLGVIPPNHLGYVHFPAALLMVFAIMFIAIAVNPFKNRNLILYGILLKISYCGVVLFHWVSTGIPNMWKPFCLFDLIFLVLFFWARKNIWLDQKPV